MRTSKFLSILHREPVLLTTFSNHAVMQKGSEEEEPMSERQKLREGGLPNTVKTFNPSQKTKKS